MVSPDRSVEVGAALLGLGGSTIIARLAYDWTAGGHFWDAWSVLGVIAGSLGLVIMVVAWVVPSEKSPAQTQAGGARSINLQAGRDINFPRNDQPGE